jgi:signal transduction histidine kinase
LCYRRDESGTGIPPRFFVHLQRPSRDQDLPLMNSALRNDSQPTEQAAIRENKLGLVERLADDLAHEIKNPLHSMVINLEVLRRRIARLEGVTGGEDLLRYTGVIATELERVNRRVELLLRMVRPQRETDDLTTLPEVLEELRELAELECERNEVELRMEVQEAIARADLPRGLARQLVLSLVLHSLDIAPPGSALEITSEITAAASRLRIGVAAGSAERATLDAEENDRSYLSVARAIAERLRGQIQVDPTTASEAGPPVTAFLLTIPR